MNDSARRSRAALPLWAIALPAIALSAAAVPTARTLAAADVIAADGGLSLDERLLDGLRARGLFDLAEKYCRERLARAELADAKRAELTIELARTLAARAIESPAVARAPIWRQAEGVVDEYLRLRPNDPQLLSLGLQKALVALAAGELGRQEAEVGGLSNAALEPARTALRDAVSQLKLLEERVAIELQRRARPSRAQPGAWSTPQLVSLATNVRFQLARAFRNQALCYLPDSSDRINSLTQAAELLKPLALLPPVTPLAWESRVDEIACLRLLRDFSASERKLAAALKEQPPPTVQHRLEAERIRRALDTGAIDQALAIAGDAKNLATGDGPDLNLARLEAYVAACSAPAQGGSANKTHWRQAAADQTRFIEQSFGAYWMRRAETLVAATIAQDPGAANFDTLLRAAESYYRGGRVDEAIAVYDRAVRLARGAGGAQQAFAPALAAATIEHQQARWRSAIDRYRDLSTAFPAHARADEAHLMAVFDAAQLAQQSAAESRRAALEEYEKLLEEHLRLWPASATSGQAAWWLGQARESAGRFEAAIEAYRLIPPGHAQFLPGLEATARSLRGALSVKRSENIADVQLAADGARYFAGAMNPPGNTAAAGQLAAGQHAAGQHAAGQLAAEQASGAWHAVRRRAALFAAEFYLEAGADGPRQAVAILEAALPKPGNGAGAEDEATAAWQNEARALLVAGLAAGGRVDDASRTLASLSAAAPETLLELAESLARRAAAAQPEARAAPARLELQALDRLEPQRAKLGEPQQRRIDLLRVQSLADSGSYDQALAMLEKLAAARPEDGVLQESLAELLSAGGKEQSTRALRKWREVQQKSRPGSARWFRASYGLAHTQYALGNKIAAAAAVRLIAKTYPELGGEAMKARFERLLADSQQ